MSFTNRLNYIADSTEPCGTQTLVNALSKNCLYIYILKKKKTDSGSYSVSFFLTKYHGSQCQMLLLGRQKVRKHELICTKAPCASSKTTTKEQTSSNGCVLRPPNKAILIRSKNMTSVQEIRHYSQNMFFKNLRDAWQERDRTMFFYSITWATQISWNIAVRKKPI